MIETSDPPRGLRQAVREQGLNQQLRGRTIVHTAGFVAAWVVFAVVAPRFGWLGWAVLVFAHGWLITGAFAAAHEAVHRHLFRSKRANRIAGWLWTLPALVPFETYRAYHVTHHVYTSVPGDSEYYGEIRSRAGLLTLLAGGVVFVASMWTATIAVIVGKPGPTWMSNPAARRRVGPSALFVVATIVAVTTAVATGALSPGVLMAWWGAGFIGFVVGLGVFSAFPEHFGCDPGPGPASETTRTTESNPVVRWLLWNANYHAAHHAVPSVPSYHLPALDELIDTKHRASGYLAFYADLMRNGVPDPVTQGQDQPTTADL